MKTLRYFLFAILAISAFSCDDDAVLRDNPDDDDDPIVKPPVPPPHRNIVELDSLSN